MRQRNLPICNKRNKPATRIQNIHNSSNPTLNTTTNNTFKIQIPTKKRTKMSQEQILKILNKKKWQTRKDIHQKLKGKVGLGSITTNLKKIRKYKLAKYRTKKILNKKTKIRYPMYVYKRK